MNHQNLLLQDDPFAPAAPDSLDCLPSHHCAVVPDIKVRLHDAAKEIASEGHCGWGNVMTEAADHIEALERQLAEAKDEENCSTHVINKLSLVLAGIAIAFRGEELPLHRHSYHDLAELAQTKMLEIDLLNYQAGELQRQFAEASKDAARMDLIDLHRIAVIPEYEGPFEAMAYQNDGESHCEPQLRATGKNAREAIDNLISAIAAMKEQA